MSEPTPRLLLLVRHAKTEQPTGGMTDHERTLLPRGVADARAGGAWLTERGLIPDLVLCSTATRTRQTWEQIAAGGGLEVEVWPDRRIYNAYPEEILEVIREAPETARTLMVVGHVPGIPSLGVGLADVERSDPTVLATVQDGMPTGSALELEVTSEWGQLAPESARLVGFHRWRGSEGSP